MKKPTKCLIINPLKPIDMQYYALCAFKPKRTDAEIRWD